MSDERRGDARYITDLNVILLPSKGGEPLDDRATAHDVSVRGFKLETQVQLQEKTLIFFTLELPGGERASGKGKVVWSNRETFATWAGVEIVSMSWGDKRKLSRLLRPDSVDFGRLTNLVFKLAMAITVLVAAHRILFSSELRHVLSSLAPKIVALVLMGWALTGMLKRDKN